MHVSGAEHVLFALPRGRWTPSTRQAGRLMYDGSYTRRLRVHGRPCTLLFGFGARRQRQRPLLRVIPGGRHARRGQHDGTRWLSWQFSLPPARQGAYARAYRAAPAGAGWRWLAVNALVEPLGRTASAGCSRAAARTDLAAVVASARIARGHLPTGS